MFTALDAMLIDFSLSMPSGMGGILLSGGIGGNQGGNQGGNTQGGNNNVNDVINNLNNGTNVVSTDLDKKVNTLGDTGFSLIQKVGIYLAVIVFVAAGIGFLLSSGQEREDKKKGLVMKIVGIVLIVGATGIVSSIAAFSGGLFK